MENLTPWDRVKRLQTEFTSGFLDNYGINFTKNHLIEMYSRHIYGYGVEMLLSYLDEKEWSDVEIAELFGIARQSVNRYRKDFDSTALSVI